MFRAQLRGTIYEHPSDLSNAFSRLVLISPQIIRIKPEIVRANDTIVSDNSGEQRAHLRHADLQGETNRFRRNDRRDTA